MTKSLPVTSGLELAGLLAIACAAGLEVASWTVAGGVAVGGALLIADSAFIARRTPAPRRGVDSA